MTTNPDDFDGCNSECRRKGAHTLRWGGCEQATPPEPTVSMSVVYTDHDGYPSIGFDTYTAAQLTDLIEPVINQDETGFAKPYDDSYGRSLAEDVAKAIIHRNNPKDTP